MNKFEQRGLQEREALVGFFKRILVKTPSTKYHLNYTPTGTYSKYDCLVTQHSLIDGNWRAIKKMFFEAKIRDKYYDTLLLEKKKIEAMKVYAKEAHSTIFYINFTPAGTFVFNLTKLELDGQINYITEKHNVETVNKDKGKIDKEIAYIDVNLGKRYDYIYLSKEEPEALSEALSDNFEAFPKEEPVKQIEMELPKETGIRRNAEGIILYDSYEEFRLFPYHIKQESLNQSRLKIFKREGDDIETMKSLLGGEDKLADFLYKRDVDDFMNRRRVTNKK
jgi:hypothetical protein